MTRHRTGTGLSKGIDTLLNDLGLEPSIVADSHPKTYALLDYAVAEKANVRHLSGLEAHLAECQMCRSEVDRMKASVSDPDELQRFQMRLRSVVNGGLATPKTIERKATIIVIPRDWW